MLVLGINELYHDCSAALVQDGRLVAVVEEERLDRVKHTPGLCWGGQAPERSMAWCLERLGVREPEIDAVALSYDMSGYLALKTVVDAALANLRRGGVDIIRRRVASGDHAAKVLQGNVLGYFGQRRRWLADMDRRFGRVVPIPHHLAHASSAYRMSGFDESNVLVIDGLGEDHSTSLFHARGGSIDGPFQTWSQYQSLGMLYKTATFLLGFGYFGDGKTMGLSSYADERPDLQDIVEVSEDGYRIRLSRIRKLARYARPQGDTALTREHQQVAASVQAMLERAAVALAGGLHRRTGSRRLCLAGGVALNCNMNSTLRAQPFVDELFVQPGAMDMGTAIGAALELSARLGCDPRERLEHVYFGPSFDEQAVAAAIQAAGLSSRRLEPGALAPTVARLLSQGRVVAWFQGGMEFGPRALGHRSILARPDSTAIRDRVNKIKQRELWRPLAPSILEERVSDWFVDAGPSPFMTLTFSFRPERRAEVPGVVHVDGTARPQTVSARTNPRYHALISAFEELTGLPMLVNTSFNRRIEPIVCTPAEALATYAATDLDCLVLGEQLLEKPR
jgi:carbamoyltransferase